MSDPAVSELLALPMGQVLRVSLYEDHVLIRVESITGDGEAVARWPLAAGAREIRFLGLGDPAPARGRPRAR